MLTCFKGFENNTGFIHKVSVEINIVHGKPENIFVQCNLDLVTLLVSKKLSLNHISDVTEPNDFTK